ncbi:GD10207 [Drosophila simulans]|uniref:GD10207 n=1 Tax=Drosophila simulans TaxID=7240 RepID=B4QF74_DROSI|nr:GD10207 [Drosophila simulans]
MRTKHLILILIGVIIATIVFIAFGPAGEPNDSFKNIVVQTHQQFKEFQPVELLGNQRELWLTTATRPRR